MSKKLLLFVALIHLMGTNNFAFSDIIPIKKPFQTKEETQKKLLIDVLRPLPKSMSSFLQSTRRFPGVYLRYP